MKRLFALFSILIALGIFTYQFEELGEQRRKVQEENRGKIIDERFLGDMLEVKAQNFHLVKKKDSYFTADGSRIDLARFQKYLDVLGKMKLKRELSPEEARNISFPKESPRLFFRFTNGEMLFELGDKLQFDQSFYMAVTQNGVTKKVIAYDSSANEGTYDKETFHRNPEKYLRFKTMMLLRDEFFVDTHLFQKEYESALKGKSIDWRILRIDNLRNRAFSIDFSNISTNPNPPEDLAVKREAFQLYLNELIGLSGTKWLEAGELEEEVASLVIEKENGEKSTVKIFKKYNKQKGSYAQLVEENKVLAFTAQMMSLFFKNAQDFWSLSPLKDKNPEKMTLKFPDSKELPVQFKHGKVFKALSLDKIAGEAVNTTFKSLLDVLGMEADHLTGFEKGEEIGESLFNVSLGSSGSQFRVILNNGELILANEEKGYKLHYRLDSLPKFGTKLKDFFIKQ